MTPTHHRARLSAPLVLLGLVACIPGTSSQGGTRPPADSEAEGIDPSLLVASRGGSTHPAAGTTAILGRGFDSLQGEVLGDCVAAAKPVSFSGSEEQGGATSDLVVRYARTREELASALGVSVEASASFGFFSGSAKASWAHRDEITSDTSFLVISNEVVNDTQSLESYRLSDAAELALRERGPEAFYRMCGDQFVAARVTGGSLHVVVQLNNASSAIERRMSAGGGIKAWVFSASGEVSTEAIEALQTESHDIKVFQAGGRGHPEGLQDLVKFAYRFRSEVTGQNAKFAAPISFVTAPYSVVPTAAKVNIPSLTQQRRRLNELAVWHGDAMTRRRDLIAAEAAGGTCIDRETRFDRAVDDVESTMRAIEVEAQMCADDPLRSCGTGTARPMPKSKHLDLVRECTGRAKNDAQLAEQRANARHQAELEAQLREVRKGLEGGSPCSVWELRAVKPKLGNVAAWVDVSASASAGGSMSATESRKLVEDSGWAIYPELRMPVGARLEVAGKVKFESGCGWFDGPCERGERVVSSHALKLSPTIADGTIETSGFTIRLECVEAARGAAGRRRVLPSARPRPAPPTTTPRRPPPRPTR